MGTEIEMVVCSLQSHAGGLGFSCRQWGIGRQMGQERDKRKVGGRENRSRD